LPKKVGRKPKKPETLEEENQRLKKKLKVLRFLQEESEVSMDCRAKRTIFSILFVQDSSSFQKQLFERENSINQPEDLTLFFQIS